MKVKYLVLVFSISFLFACNKEDDLFEIMPVNDLIALEEMGEAFEHALLYNDSLTLCSTEAMSCDPSTIAHYDELFHQFDEMFNLHHENFSHNNIGDDHHHEAGNTIRHGWMMNDHEEGEHHEEEDDDDEHGEEDEHGNEDEHHYEHNLNTYHLMKELREHHAEVHPG